MSRADRRRRTGGDHLWPDCSYQLGAAAFDRANGRFYVIQRFADTTAEAQPLVHVVGVSP